MEERRTSVFENGLIWFGAAVSIAEILTGTYFAPLGFTKGLLAILIGHIIGCAMLFFAGLMGGNVRKSAMETAKMSFGSKGALLFSILNILQLVGWTAIIGGLIVLWILIGLQNLGKVNTVAMAALFALTIVLSFVIFGNGSAWNVSGEGMTFGAAVELSVAMPLSWLPLISDYTRAAEKPLRATAVSVVTYGAVSCWMYVIGMGAAMFTGESDIAQILMKAGLGIAGLLIIIFSTVTTTFLDAYSAGVSSESLWEKINGKWVAVGVTIIGTLGAIFLPLYDITEFLYFIGSVFVPMIAIQIADFFLLKKPAESRPFNLRNLAIWLVGFLLYRLLMGVDIPVGNTLPDMVLTILLCVAVHRMEGKYADK